MGPTPMEAGKPMKGTARAKIAVLRKSFEQSFSISVRYFLFENYEPLQPITYITLLVLVLFSVFLPKKY